MTSQKNFIFTFIENLKMFEVDIFPIYGLIVGVNYSNEDIELLDVVADDKRHTIQIFLFLIGFNIHFFTTR